jgi:hypothetical protein
LRERSGLFEMEDPVEDFFCLEQVKSGQSKDHVHHFQGIVWHSYAE